MSPRSSRQEKTLDPLRKRLRSLPSSRHGLALLLRGQPGSGKSHSVRELSTNLSYRTALVPANASLSVLLQSLAGGGAHAGWSKTILDRAAQGEGVESGQLADAIAARMSQLAPFLLMVEDLHEVSPERGQFWLQLAKCVRRGHGLGLLVTSREPAVEPFEELRLEPLNDDEVVALLNAEVHAELPGEASAWIAQRASGNPLFALEYFRHLARQGFLWSDTRRWRWRTPENDRLPSSIQALISHRLRDARSSESHGRVIDALAFIRERPVAGVLAPLLELSPKAVAEILADLTRAGIVHEGEFAHPLFREVALQQIPTDRVRELASRALELYSSEPLEAARYLEQAQLAPEKARELLDRAAQLAREAQDLPAAAELLTMASRYASGEEREELLIEAARYLRHSHLPRALELSEQVISSNPRHAEGIFLHGQMLVLSGRDQEAQELLDRLSQEGGLRSRWQLESLRLRAERGDFAGALDVWEAHPELRKEAPADVLRAVAFSMLQQGRLDEAERLVAAALEDQYRLTGGQRANLLHVKAAASFYRGNYAAANEDWREVVTLLRNERDRLLLGRALGNRVSALRSLGRYREAIPIAHESIQVFSELGLGRDYARQRYSLANLLRSQAEYERAEDMLLESRDVFEWGGDHRYLIACDIDLGYLYLSWRPAYAPSLTLRHAHTALEVARERETPPSLTAQALRLAAQAEALYGDPHRALSLADEIGEVKLPKDRWQRTAFAAARAFALEALGREEQALALYLESARIDEAAGNLLQAHDMLLEAARLSGNVSAARRHLDFFRERGLLNMARLTCLYFPSLLEEERREEPETPLVMEILGPLRLRKAGAYVAYRARKGRELLARLLEARMAGSGQVDQLELQETFYPGLADDRAASSLQQLIYRLRSSLGNEAVLRTGSGYMLGAVTSDAEEFLERGDVSLWRGPYLQDVGDGWEPAVRRQLERELRTRIEMLLEQESVEAARLAQILLESEPYDLERLRLALLALSVAGQDAAADAAYQQARQRFTELGETLPPDRHRFLSEVGAR